MSVARALVVACLFVGVGCGEPARAPDATATATPVAPAGDERADIAKMLDDWHDAAAKADEARYFGHLDEASVFMGTDATERWTKKAFLAYSHPHFAKGKAWSFRATRREVVVDVAGRFAHFDEDLETKGLGPARGSGVAVKADGAWKILHYNLTITVPNDRFDLVKEAAGPASVLDSKGDPLADVSIISGAWIGKTKEGEDVEEHWTHAAGGTLIGSARSIKAGKTTFFEHLRIERRDDGSVVYVAQPLGKPPTEFRKTAGKDAADLVFENPKHDWPKRIRYRVAEGQIDVTVEGGPGQPVDAYTLRPAVVRRSQLER